MQMTLKQKLYNYRYQIAVIFIIAVGVFVRVFRFGQVPAGFNQDEAFAAYEAYSLLNFGKDSAGYSFPTYFVSWGSGMNVLEKIIYVADYMEPNRNFPGVEKLRELAFTDMDAALKLGLEMTLAMLRENGQDISPESAEALSFLQRTGV